MRAERMLRILLLLQVHDRLTAGDLAQRLETSARTIQRDLDALSLAGIPVYATRGRTGGWALARDYRTRLTGLTPAEAMTVFVGTTAHALADLGLTGASDSALTKLLSALPEHARRDAEYARQRVLVDHSSWSGAGDTATVSPLLEVVRQALWEQRWVRLTYGKGGKEFPVAPLGLVAKGRTWYLVAQRRDLEIRTYRMTRVTGAACTGDTFERPAGFDLDDHWRRACAEFFAGLPQYPVELDVRTDAVHRLSWAPSTKITSVDERPDGWSAVAMTFENHAEAQSFLLGMAGDAVVLAPVELRADLRRAASRVARLHAEHGELQATATVAGER